MRTNPFHKPGSIHGRKRVSERGSTLVEFALAAPILFMVTFLIVDLGLYFFREHTVQFATREGMRLALVGTNLKDANGNPMGREASIVTTIHRIAGVSGIKPNQMTISIYPLDNNYNDPANWRGQRNPGQPGQYMRVRTEYEYSFLPLVKAIGPIAKATISASGTYRNEMFE
jgi:hypothetical protein